MAKHGVATIPTSTVGAGVRTCAADLPCARHQCVFDAAMAPAQESGLRENCTSRLSERAEAGRTLDLSRLYSYEAGEQSERAHCGGIYRGKRSGAGGAKGGGQGECAPAKHALDSEPGSRVTGAGAYTASNCRHTRGGSVFFEQLQRENEDVRSGWIAVEIGAPFFAWALLVMILVSTIF